MLLVVIGSFIYSFNLNNKLFWDDDDWIVNNVSVHSVSWSNVKFWLSNNVLAGVGLKSNYYRPLLFFTFAVNYAISGVKPLAYHLTSNLIHIFNSILVFWLFQLTFKRNLLAFLVSIFFLIHPLQTEAITYISGRGDALVAMFMLLALLLFLKSESAAFNIINLTKRKFSTFYFLLSTFFLILGLLSRETGIMFPALALIFYIAALSPRSDLGTEKGRTFLWSIRRGLVKTGPYFAVVFIYGILRLTVLNFQNTLNFYSQPNLYSENLRVRIFTFLPILWEYIKLLFVPVGLHMERGRAVYTSLFQWPVWPVFLGLLGLLYWLKRLYKKEKRTIIQTHNLQPTTYNLTPFRIWFFGLGWFFIALLPVSGITPINALMYEHWLYLPMVGFWLIISFYLVKLLNFKGPTFLKIQGRALIIAALVVYFAFFAYQSIQRNILWGDAAAFYENILKYEPESARINNNLGAIYYNRGDLNKAAEFYQNAAKSGDFAQPHFNLGNIYQMKGDIASAIKEYEKAIAVDPNFIYAYQNLASIYSKIGNSAKAREYADKLERFKF